MIRYTYSMKVNHVFILAAGFLLANVLTNLTTSHVVLAIDSSAPAKKDNTPVGTVVSWAGEVNSIPKNWLLCDGKLLDRGKYPDLFKAIGTSWGGRGTKFNLPDLRGRFLRGDDAGSHRDPDRDKRYASRPGGNKTGIGSVQGDSIQNHGHLISQHDHTYNGLIVSVVNRLDLSTGSLSVSIKTDSFANGQHTDSSKSKVEDAIRYRTNNSLDVGEETRPKNAAVHWIIKVK